MTMRILNPTAKRKVAPRVLTSFTTTTSRIGILHNHSPHFNRLAEALPEPLRAMLHAEIVDTYTKERYSSGAPPDMILTLSHDYDLTITGLAA
ncbi:MAG: hypothetical protein O7G88_12695 [bacterium]|nr:hypothetical protein [bacterium]